MLTLFFMLELTFSRSWSECRYLYTAFPLWARLAQPTPPEIDLAAWRVVEAWNSSLDGKLSTLSF